jgi:hypothetical protein
MVGASVGRGPGMFTLGFGIESTTETGTSVDFRIGKMLNSKLILSTGIDLWTRSEGAADFTFYNVAAALTMYPIVIDVGGGGPYIRWGMGVAGADFDDPLAGTLSKHGLGLLAAAGYEYRLTEGFALGAGAGYEYLLLNGDVLDSARFAPFVLDVSWYF